MKTYKTKKAVAELDKVVKLCGAIGADYMPGNEVLMPTALTSLLVVANEKMKAVNSAHVAAAMLRKQRAASFKGIPNLAARIVRLVSSTQATAVEKMQAREIKRKYFNTPVKYKLVKDASVADAPEPKPKTSSWHYGDYESKLDGLMQLIRLVSGISGYKSGDAEYSKEGLNAKLAELQALHSATLTAKFALAKVREERDAFAEHALFPVLQAFKGYMLGKFGFQARMLQQL